MGDVYTDGFQGNDTPVQSAYNLSAQLGQTGTQCHWCGRDINQIMSVGTNGSYCSIECYNAGG